MMPIHPEYPNPILATYFNWATRIYDDYWEEQCRQPNRDGTLYRIMQEQLKNPPAELRTLVEGEFKRIEDWLRAHFEELKRAYEPDIQALFAYIADEWPKRADVQLQGRYPLEITFEVTIASKREREANSYSWFADEVTLTERTLGPAAQQILNKLAIDAAIQQIIRYLQGDPDNLGDFVFELFEDFQFDDERLKRAYWMTTLHRQEPPLLHNQPFTGYTLDDESLLPCEWVKLLPLLPPDIACLLEAACDWTPTDPHAASPDAVTLG